MLLVTIQQSFRSSHVIGQFVSVNEGFHLRHPAGQIPEVSSEALQAGEQKKEGLYSSHVADIYIITAAKVEQREKK